MLIGVGGKFHYRRYVEHIGHNNQIEYVCNKTYVLIGPPMTTCDDLRLHVTICDYLSLPTHWTTQDNLLQSVTTCNDL